jgi:hypothetical protein
MKGMITFFSLDINLFKRYFSPLFAFRMKKFLLLFFTLITLGISQKAEATHMMGADFEFACLGNDSFLIRVKVYKDCRGISLSPIQLDIDGKGCSYSKSYTMSQISCEDVTPVCKSGCSKMRPAKL